MKPGHTVQSERDAQRADWQNDLQRILQPRAFGRLFIATMLVRFGSLILLGIAFFIISYGIWYALTHLAIYWAPIYRVLAAVEGVNLDPSRPTWRFAPITVWHIPGLILKTALSIGLTAFGVSLLLKMGFCQQNFICLLLGSGNAVSP